MCQWNNLKEFILFFKEKLLRFGMTLLNSKITKRGLERNIYFQI